MALTPKQQAFVAEYLIDLNAAAAARRAGYSEKTSKQIGSELLGRPEVAAAIAVAQQERSARTQITQDTVIEEIAAVAFAEVRDIVDWGTEQTKDGLRSFVRLRGASELSTDAARSVSEVRLDASGRLTVRMHDKLRALELLGRHLGMFKHTIELPGAVEVRLAFDPRCPSDD